MKSQIYTKDKQSDSLFNAKKFHIEYQRSILRDDTRIPSLAVRIIRRASQLGTLSFRHFRDTFVPTSDHLAFTKLKFEWLATITRGIEFLSVGQSTSVMDLDCLSFGCE